MAQILKVRRSTSSTPSTLDFGRLVISDVTNSYLYYGNSSNLPVKLVNYKDAALVKRLDLTVNTSLTPLQVEFLGIELRNVTSVLTVKLPDVTLIQDGFRATVRNKYNSTFSFVLTGFNNEILYNDATLIGESSIYITPGKHVIYEWDATNSMWISFI